MQRNSHFQSGGLLDPDMTDVPLILSGDRFQNIRVWNQTPVELDRKLPGMVLRIVDCDLPFHMAEIATPEAFRHSSRLAWPSRVRGVPGVG